MAETSDTSTSLGASENPWPSWAINAIHEARKACRVAGKHENEFFDELLPALAKVVRQVEQILRNSGRADCQNFSAQNILRISGGQIFIKVFTCVNGHCHVPAEGPLGEGIHQIREKGWHNLEFDFDD